MNFLFILLQASPIPVDKPAEESFFSLLMKGGWILVPIFLLLFVAIYVIIERWLVINHSKNKDNIWLSRINELIQERKTDKALNLCAGMTTSSSKVIRAGIQEADHSIEEVQEAMQTESRQEIGKLELRMNYLGITASIAPMLGFLGTIFGVIKIFYNISVTNDLNIANISDGLYQKMICSGAGLFVGIIAYAGYHILNGMIDRTVNQMDKDSNEVLKYIRLYKKNNIA